MNLSEQVDLDQKNKILLPHVWWKDRKPLILGLFFAPAQAVSLSNLETFIIALLRVRVQALEHSYL